MKLLVIKLGHLGDVLIMTPALQGLRKAFPNAQIDVIVRRGTETMLAGNPDIDRVFLVPGPKIERANQPWHMAMRDFATTLAGVGLRCYDYGFDLSGTDRARLWLRLSLTHRRCANNPYGELAQHASFYHHLSAVPWTTDHQVRRDFGTVKDAVELPFEAGPLRFVPQAAMDRIQQKMPELTLDAPFAVIHPTSRWAYKQWSAERWAAVADALHERFGLRIIFSTGPAEREQQELAAIEAAAKHRHVATRGRLSLHELGLLLGQARLFLGVDTVAMHLAAAMQTPTVALFGPSTEVGWGPWQTRNQLVLGPCACKLTRKFVCDKSRIYPCMEAITTDEVITAAAQTLSPATP